MSDNMKVWNALKEPPPEALKKIQGGRLQGMTDISPQWRYKAMTEQFGMCGVGWKYEVVRTWQEAGSDDQVFAFAEVRLSVKPPHQNLTPADVGWSDPIPGIGGSMLIAKEKAGPHSSDEAYKMAITDALSVAMKMIGVGADVYMGMMDGKHGKTGDKAPGNTTGKATGATDGKEGKKEAGMRKTILEICMKIAGDDKEQAGGVLYDFTEWKDGDKVKRKGVRTGEALNGYTGKVLGAVYASAKDGLKAWEATQGPVDSEDGDGSTWNEETQEYEW